MFSITKLPSQFTGKRKRGVAEIVAFILLGVLLANCGGILSKEGRRVHAKQQAVAGNIAREAQVAELRNQEGRLTVLYEAEDELKQACGEIKHMGHQKLWDKVVGVWTAILTFLTLDWCELSAQLINLQLFQELPVNQYQNPNSN